MGCGSSTTAVVHPIRPTDEVGKSVEGDIEGKCGRGDSAVSKVTEDSGVVMAPVVQNAEVLPVDAFPGEVPVKPPGLLGREVPMRDPPTSSDILQELQNEGIIPASPSRETTTGRAYTIMLDDSEGIRRRPPARLESLKVKRLPSKEEMEEKMRLADERRKSREDELTARLRSKSARVRRAAAFVPPRSPPDVEGVRRSASGAAAP
ncbi:uncharacterized protein stmnd1 isoform X2 [Phyllopteryx taeniolatus]|uniref:uncharacterized protein stmnd1 isoform X2 n=1 Tax=Phyllopteryx taeniolatus TaxID=161469 RepID=UPI002AD41630|nr:uncharacterized protein stmnd1 isoform X2 [Phyllopteryx taeniolatus]